MIKFHRQHKFYKFYPTIGNTYPSKVNIFLSLENVAGLYKPVNPIRIRPWTKDKHNNKVEIFVAN